MKKKKLLGKLKKLETMFSSMQEANNRENDASSDIRNQELLLKNQESVLNRVSAIGKSLNQMSNENQQVLSLLKLMNKTHIDVIEKVRDSQDKINTIYMMLDSPEFRNIIGQQSNSYATVYTDASLGSNMDACGYGIVVESSNGTVYEYNGIVEKPENVRDVSIQLGEAYGIIKALEILDSQMYNDVVVYTDNVNIVDWAEGKLVNPKDCREWFNERMNDLKKYMNISVIWMKRCSCDYNRRADKLARVAMYEDSLIKSEQLMTGETFNVIDFNQSNEA